MDQPQSLLSGAQRSWGPKRCDKIFGMTEGFLFELEVTGCLLFIIVELSDQYIEVHYPILSNCVNILNFTQFKFVKLFHYHLKSS